MTLTLIYLGPHLVLAKATETRTRGFWRWRRTEATVRTVARDGEADWFYMDTGRSCPPLLNTQLEDLIHVGAI